MPDWMPGYEWWQNKCWNTGQNAYLKLVHMSQHMSDRKNIRTHANKDVRTQSRTFPSLYDRWCVRAQTRFDVRKASEHHPHGINRLSGWGSLEVSNCLFFLFTCLSVQASPGITGQPWLLQHAGSHIADRGLQSYAIWWDAMQFGEIVKFLAMFEGILVLLVQLLMVKLRVPFVIPMVSVSITRE